MFNRYKNVLKGGVFGLMVLVSVVLLILLYISAGIAEVLAILAVVATVVGLHVLFVTITITKAYWHRWWIKHYKEGGWLKIQPYYFIITLKWKTLCK
jgi:hypothetical protein